MKTIILLLIGITMLVSCSSTGSAEDAMAKIMEARNANDYGYVWDQVDKVSQGELNTSLGFMYIMSNNVDDERMAELKAMDGKELFLLVMDSPSAKKIKKFDWSGVKLISTDGDKASFTNDAGDDIAMIVEDGRWKISVN